MADHPRTAAGADGPGHAVALDAVEAALIAAIYGAGRSWRPSGSRVVGVAFDMVATMGGHVAIPSTPIRERHSMHAPLRAFVAAAGGRGWPWAAARIASWRDDVVLLRAGPTAPLRVLRVRSGVVLGEDQPGTTAYASVVRVLLGPGAA